MAPLPKRITTQLEKYKRSSDSGTSSAAMELHAQLIQLIESDAPSSVIYDILALATERLDIIHSLSLSKHDLAFLEPDVIRDVIFRIAVLVNDRQNDSNIAAPKSSSPPLIR